MCVCVGGGGGGGSAESGREVELYNLAIFPKFIKERIYVLKLC